MAHGSRAIRRSFAALCLVVSVSAGLRADQSGGVLAGFGRAEINATDEATNVRLTQRAAPVAGVFVSFPMERAQFRIEPEFLLVVKGTAWKVDGKPAALDLTYVDLPVLVRYAGPPGRPTQWQVFAGPSLGVRVRATYRAAATTARPVDVGSLFRRLDAGWVAGIGVARQATRVELRYGGSLLGIAPDGGLDAVFDAPAATYRNRSFAVLAGYGF